MSLSHALAFMSTQLRWHLVRLWFSIFPRRHGTWQQYLPQIWPWKQGLGAKMDSESFALGVIPSCIAGTAFQPWREDFSGTHIWIGTRGTHSTKLQWASLWSHKLISLQVAYHQGLSFRDDTRPIGLHCRFAFYQRIGRKKPCSGSF